MNTQVRTFCIENIISLTIATPLPNVTNDAPIASANDGAYGSLLRPAQAMIINPFSFPLLLFFSFFYLYVFKT